MKVDEKGRYDFRIILFLGVILSVFVCSNPAVLDRVNWGPGEPSSEPECLQLDLTKSDLIAVACNNIIDGSLTRSTSSDTIVFFFEPIPINHASFALLQTVKGVGPKLAQEIIDYRERLGPFSDMESMKKLAGVGERRARYLATQFTFE